MNVSVSSLPALKRDRPEWSPWLAVVEHAVSEIGAPVWDLEASERHRHDDAAPMLAGAALTLNARVIHRLLARLTRAAGEGGSANMAALRGARFRDADALDVFVAAMGQHEQRVRVLARTSGVDADAFQAVAALVPVPFLQAYHRRCRSSFDGWQQGYCPVCGAWPAFAEVRGIERSRCLRCGRCGAAWQAHTLHCPFCSTRDHRELAMLVPQKDGPQAAVEACRRCGGYIKSFTRLQGCAPAAIMIEDLATVDLDVAALGLGYARPERPGYSFEVTLAPLP
jgi:FdhE protein